MIYHSEEGGKKWRIAQHLKGCQLLIILDTHSTTGACTATQHYVAHNYNYK